MSMPCIDLECERCDFKDNDMVTWGRYKYLDGENEYWANRCLGWCSDCKKLAPIEDFSDADEVVKKLEETPNELKGFYGKGRLFRLLNIFRSRIHHIEQLPELAKRLNIISSRKGTEKCLDCGSAGVKKFDGDYQLDYEGLLYQGEKRTGFIHPDCGGEMIAQPHPTRYNMAFTTRYYNLDGTPVSKE